MPSGLKEVQNHSLGGDLPNSAFALWQVQIAYLFSILGLF